MVLVRMKETAEAYLSEKVTHAVITIPACKSIPYILQSILTDTSSQTSRHSASSYQRRWYHRRSQCPPYHQRAPLLLPLPMVLTRKMMNHKSLSMILEEEPPMCPSFPLTTVFLRSWQLLVIPTLVVKILITGSSTTSSSSIRRRLPLTSLAISVLL